LHSGIPAESDAERAEIDRPAAADVQDDDESPF
jgi:hypothetical protein